MFKINFSCDFSLKLTAILRKRRFTHQTPPMVIGLGELQYFANNDLPEIVWLFLYYSIQVTTFLVKSVTSDATMKLTNLICGVLIGGLLS